MHSCTAEDSQRNFSVAAPRISQSILPQKIQSIFPPKIFLLYELWCSQKFPVCCKNFIVRTAPPLSNELLHKHFHADLFLLQKFPRSYIFFFQNFGYISSKLVATVKEWSPWLSRGLCEGRGLQSCAVSNDWGLIPRFEEEFSGKDLH